MLNKYGSNQVVVSYEVEVCMGMGKTGIPWDSHGNGSKISHLMGMGWERELSAWELELRRGNWKKNAAYCRLHCNQQALATVLLLALLHNLRPYDHYN